MHAALPFIIAIVVFAVVANFVMLFVRLRRDRYRKPNRVAMDEEKAARMRAAEIQRRLAWEQQDATEYVELRNKTFALYEEVRKRAAERERLGIEYSSQAPGVSSHMSASNELAAGAEAQDPGIRGQGPYDRGQRLRVDEKSPGLSDKRPGAGEKKLGPMSLNQSEPPKAPPS